MDGQRCPLPMEFFRSTDALFREYFRDTRMPFSMTLMGQKLYVLTSPQDVTQVTKDTSSFTFDEYIRDIMVAFDATPSAVESMWRKPFSNNAPSQANPFLKVLGHLGEDLYRQQLNPGKRLDALESPFFQIIDDSLTWKNISETCMVACPDSFAPTSKDPDVKTVSLLKWTRQVLLHAATTAFFGPTLLEIAPDIFRNFFDFDDNSWKLTYKVPRIFAKEMEAAKASTVDALTAYFALPIERRPGAAWLIRTLESEMRNVDIGDRDIARFIMMLYWVYASLIFSSILSSTSARLLTDDPCRTNSNAYKLCFWILTFLAHNPSLLSSVRTEVAHIDASADRPAERQEPPLNVTRLTTHAPILNAIYNETLRLTNSSSSVRTVVRPTVLTSGARTPTVLQPGNRVLIPYRQGHFNPHVFGPDVDRFDHTRFLRDKDLERNPSFRPFGSGSTHCPGRFLARREVVVFVALVVRRFDVALAATADGRANGLPEIETKKPCLGVMGVRDGQDCVVQVSRRQR